MDVVMVVVVCSKHYFMSLRNWLYFLTFRINTYFKVNTCFKNLRGPLLMNSRLHHLRLLASRGPHLQWVFQLIVVFKIQKDVKLTFVDCMEVRIVCWWSSAVVDYSHTRSNVALTRIICSNIWFLCLKLINITIVPHHVVSPSSSTDIPPPPPCWS